VNKLNVIYNEDCLRGLKKIEDKSIDLVIIDPPYDIAVGHGKNRKNKLSSSIDSVEQELISNDLVNGFDILILDELVRVMKNINIYIWCNGRQIPMYLRYFVENLKCKYDILIWGKTNAMPLYNNKYMSDKEYCLYFRKNSFCNPTNYEDAKTIYMSTLNQKDKKKYNHPTIKPLPFIRKLIRNSSKEGDVILDSFIGSGTTAVASILENRNYIGFEKNKNYYEICINRINEILDSKEGVENNE